MLAALLHAHARMRPQRPSNGKGRAAAAASNGSRASTSSRASASTGGLAALSTDKLRQLCKQRGLPAKGERASLLARLRDADTA